MYQDNIKSIGEHFSVAEELLNEVPELEVKCRAVEKSVAEGYFTIEEALRNYKVREIEYVPYFLLKHNQKLKKAKKQSQVFDTIQTIVSIFYPSIDKFDTVGKRALTDIKKISEKVASNNKILVK